MSRMRSIPVAPNSGFGGRDKGATGGGSSSLVVGSLADKFLGTSLGGSSPSPTAYCPLDEEPDDVLELKEEDVWESQDPDYNGKPDVGAFVAGPDGRGFGAGRGYGARGHVAAPSATYREAGDSLRYLGNGHHASGSKEGKPRSIPIGGVSLAMASAGRLDKQKQKQHAQQQEPGGGSSEVDVGAAANQSAPMNVPDWSKIYRLERKPEPAVYSSDDEEDDGTGRKHRLHPHEIVARDYARSHARQLSFSMCEGVGRTLKGRDLREVRNAVLRRTGFLE